MQVHAARTKASEPVAPDWRSVAAYRFPRHNLVERRRFVMQDELVAMVWDGRKRTTIRFDEHGLEFPSSAVLPVYAVGGGRPHGEATQVGKVALTDLHYTRCKDLSTADAKADGFASRAELVEALTRFYPSITPDSLVCVYTFAPVGSGPDASAADDRFRDREDASAALATA